MTRIQLDNSDMGNLLKKVSGRQMELFDKNGKKITNSAERQIIKMHPKDKVDLKKFSKNNLNGMIHFLMFFYFD